MKKTLEYLYIFSKLSTSFILLFSILVLGYFFYASFNDQEKSNNDQAEVINQLNNNAEKISTLSNKIENTDISLDEIKKITQNYIITDKSEEIILLNKEIEKLNFQLKNISINLQEIKLQNMSKSNEIKSDNSSSFILDKNKIELAQLVFFKFGSNLNFTEELEILQNLNDSNKQHIFEKINLIKLKNFRGNIYIKNIFSQELDIFIKNIHNTTSTNFISKSLMRFIEVQPSKINKINNNEINALNEVSVYLSQKNYKTFYEKIININNYEKHFKETINQIEIYIEFEELIKKVS